MYKNQFARWGFFKYAVKRRPPRTRAESLARRDRVRDQNRGRDPGIYDDDDGGGGIEVIVSRGALMHASDELRGMHAGLTAVRRFLHGHVDLDAANRKVEEVAGFVDPCYRYFKVAMDLFDLRENVVGGRVLRLAFLQIERKMDKPSMKSFSDLCLLVPHLLLESGRRDILAAYLRYLARLATVKYGSHPVAELAAALAAVADRPADLLRYIMLLAQCNADTIAALPGVLDRTRQWARMQYHACQRAGVTRRQQQQQQHSPPLLIGGGGGGGHGGDNNNTSTNTSLDLVALRPHENQMIRLEAQSVYWAQRLVMQDPACDELAGQWMRRRFDGDFAARCEAYLARLDARVAAGDFLPAFARMMEGLIVGWLHDYYEAAQQWDLCFRWGRRGLELSSDEQYAIWSIHLEALMRRHGDPAEADELRRRRLAHEWLEKVRQEVDRLMVA